MKKNIGFVIILSFLAFPLLAQKYNTALGVRVGANLVTGLGSGVGITLQQRVLKTVTVEGIAQTSFGKGGHLMGLLEFHTPILKQKRINLYYGPGIYTGRDADKLSSSGFAAIGGLEATLGPVNLSVDLNLKTKLAGESDKIFGSQIGISARYVLVKAPKKEFFGIGDKKKKKNKNKNNGGILDGVLKKDN